MASTTLFILIGVIFSFGFIFGSIDYLKEQSQRSLSEEFNRKKATIKLGLIKQQIETERAATPKDGIEKFAKYVQKNLIYPQKAIQLRKSGEVKLAVTIGKDGKIGYISVLKGIGYGCDEAALIFMRESPNWIPASNQNTPVEVIVEITFLFVLE